MVVPATSLPLISFHSFAFASIVIWVVGFGFTTGGGVTEPPLLVPS